jgi:hypothetical protein
MGKIVIYGLVVLIALFFLEFFHVVDIPYLEIPDYVSTKMERLQDTEEAIDQLK